MKITDFIKNKFIYIPIQAKASIAFVMCNIIQRTISFLTTPLFTRLLTTAQYGQFSLFQSWYSLIEIFATLSLFNAPFNNGMIEYKSRQEEFISSMQGLSTVATAVVMAIVITGWNFWQRIIQLPFTVVLLLFLQMFLYPAFLFWSAGQRYRFKYKSLVAFTIIIAFFVSFLSCLAIIFNNYQEYNGLIRIATSVFIQSTFGLGFYIYNFSQGKILFEKEYWKSAIVFSVPLIPHYLANIILGQIDRIMIANYANDSQVAIYSLAIQISLLMNFINTAIWSSLTPWIYQTIGKEREKDIGWIANILSFLMCAFILFSSFLAPEIIRILGSEEYIDGMWLIAPVSITVLLRFIYGFFSVIEFYYGYSYYATITSVIGALINVGLNAIFIPKYGYKYAGYTTLFCYVLMTILHYFFMKHTLKRKKITNNIYNNATFFFIILFAFIVSAFCYLLYSTTVTRIFVAIIFEVLMLFMICYHYKLKSDGKKYR